MHNKNKMKIRVYSYNHNTYIISPSTNIYVLIYNNHKPA